MSTFTIRVTSSALDPSNTALGQQPDQGLPSYFDVAISGSTDPNLPNGVYDGYCLNPVAGIAPGTSYSAQNLAGNTSASYVPIGFSSLAQTQVDQINWLLSQNFTADAKYGGQYGFGEVQVAIWKVLGFNDAAIGSLSSPYLTDNGRSAVTTADINTLVGSAQAAVASGNGVVPTDAFFSMIIDPQGNVQPLILQLQSAKLGNFVWEDTNRNGVQDAGEQGVDRVVVELYNSAGVRVASTLTGDDFSTAAVEHGFYQFAGLKAGSYQVKIVAPTYDFTVQDSGGNDAADSDVNTLTGLSHVVTLAAGESNQTIDAGIVQKTPAGSSISGFVYGDTNNDGIRQPGESGLGGVTMLLTGTDVLGNIVNRQVQTAPDGSYRFDGLVAGTYNVTEQDQPAGLLDGKDTAGSTGGQTVVNDVISSITLGANQASTDNNFGEILPAKLSGYVYVDAGDDGAKGAGEAGIGGVTVTLTGLNDLGQAVTATATTNALGFYEFTGLRPGSYTVTETQPGAYSDGKDTAGTTGGTAGNDVISNITLGSGADSQNNNFGELPKTNTIAGVVFEDKDNDGIQDPGEPGIPGATVTLTGTDTAGNPVNRTVTTGPDGSYVFTGVPAGNYTVTETQPNGYLDGKDSGGNSGGTVTDDRVSNVSLPFGVSTAVTGVNFGEQLPAKLSGYVYVDAGDDGVKGAGETPIAGVTVTLSGTDNLGNPVTATATTNALGFYEFTGLRPGSYTVTETQPGAYSDGKDTAGTTGGTAGNDVISNITLGSGADSQNNNFGELPKTNTIAGVVFEDKDNDGIQDPGEPGIPGATVTLTGTDTAGNPVNRTVTTGPDGSYVFTGVPAGNYTVTETQPNGYLDGKDSGGNSGGTVTDDRVSNVSLPFGVSTAVTGVNFGEQLPAKLSGYVYVDAGDDGVKGAGETPIAGVTVTLSGTDNLGNPVTATATTNALGFYEFTGLRPGSYTVTETQPGAYSDGKDTAGTTGGTAGNDVISNITLGSGADSQNNNFGELPKTNTIAGVVFEDKDNDGIQDPGEPGIPGATVTLTGTDTAGNPVNRTVTTGPDGSYVFTGVPAGNYTVTETQPNGYLDGKDSGGNSGGTVTDDRVSNVSLPFGVSTAVTGVNFGEQLPAKLSGYVYVDAGDDGVKGAGETPIAGVTVTLSGTDNLGNPVTATATTNALGFYEFTGLRPGSYTVTETQPGAYSDGKDTAGTTGGTAGNDVISNITLGSGADSQNNNFGELPKTNTIAGVVFEDKDNDGIQDPGEPGIPGATVTLTGTDTAGNPVNRTVTTGPDGSYVFTGVPAGNYTVTETQPNGYLDGKDSGGNSGGTVTDDRVSNVSLPFGVSTAVTGVNFGEQLPAKLSGYVYVDAGDDGVKGAGETPIAGVTVTLSGTDNLGNPVTATTTTNALGFYEFTGLRPGSYTVTETQPGAYSDGKDTAGTTGGTAGNDVISNITLGSGADSQNNNFGELPKTNTIAGVVFEDKDNDGIQDPGEPGIPGATVTLTGTDTAGNPVNRTVTTGPDGSYVFTGVPAGNYTVTETQPNGYLDGKDSGGNSGGTVTDDRVSNVSLPFGVSTAVTGVNFGEQLPAKLSGYVYVDAGNDGVKGAGEAGLAGVTVKLTGTDDLGAPVTATATTDANGFYQFTGLRPGTYTVTETQPVGYTDGKETAGTTGGNTTVNDVISNVVLTSGANSQNNNFGEQAPLSRVGDFVWEDKNGNGLQDAGEAGIAGATVQLKDANGVVVQTTTTDANGAYGFNVAAGTYSVNIVAPAGYTATTKDANANGSDAADSDIGANGQTDQFTVGAGVTNLTIDGGFYKAAEIGNFIWYDKNANGLQDAGEAGVAGVTVELRTNGVDGVDGGSVLQTTVTDANGKYLFSNLRPGDYHIDVQENTLPAGFVFTRSNVGANDAIDSDVRATAAQPLNWGIMSNTNLVSGENDLTWDAGVYKVGIDVEKYVSSTLTTTPGTGGGEGANCNYWASTKTTTGWSGITGYTGAESFNQIFGTNYSWGSRSIYDSVRGTGATSTDKFMRESVTAWLNASHDKVDYAYSKEEVVAHTKWSGDNGKYDEASKAYEIENNKGSNWTDSKSTWSSVVDTQLYDADAPPGLEVKAGSTVTFTYIVKNTGDTALKNIVLTDDRIATVTYVGGDTNFNGLLDTTETWTFKAQETASTGTIKNTGTVVGVDTVGGTSVTDKDDAYYTGTGALKSSIGDRVWEDSNGNGLQDAGERGLAGVKVTLNGAGKDGVFGNADDITATTTTGTNGNYQFTGLDAGKYTVSFGTFNGYKYTVADAGANANDATDSDANATTGKTGQITLGAGEQNLTVDAGLVGIAKLGIDVEKYVSSTLATTTNNGGSEGGSSGEWVSKCTTTSSWQWVATSWFGGYWNEVKTPTGFSGISGLTGKESFNQVFGTSMAGGSKSIYDVLVGTSTASGDKMMRESVAAYLNASHSKVDYAYSKEEVVAHTQWGVSSGRYDDVSKAYEQENNKGADWVNDKTAWNSVVDTQLYDADAPPGLEVKTGSTVTFTYIVKNTGDTALKNVVLTDDRIATVTYVSGDTDKDGLLDVGETWTYTAKEAASAGTIRNIGTVTAVDSTGSGRTVTDADAAYYTGTGALKSSLGNFVWEDRDGDGIQDAGEAGVSGVKVTLTGAGKDNLFGTADDITAVTTTNAYGKYEFNNLDAGKYKVDFDAASGWFFTKANQGTNDAVDSDVNASGTSGEITLQAGEQNQTLDAGIFRKASVGDKVWQDSNHNWVQDAGEAGIGGITVSLLNAAGAVVATTRTDSYGKYLFSNIDPGTYQLQFDKTNVTYLGFNMSTWKWAVKDSGSNDAIDSDVAGDGVATTNVSKTAQFTLDSGEADMTRDAGITPIVIDLDGNGIQTVSRADAQGSFDLLGTGKAIASGWLSGNDGFLAVDTNGNGKIDGISELFGGNSKGDGFAKLARFDSNGDGLVNDLDSAFGQLQIWRDANGNHQTDAGELMSLADAGVASLSVRYTELPQLDEQGNLHLERSTATLADGQSVAMTDVYFNVSAEDAAEAGVTLPGMNELLGNDSSLDALLGGAIQSVTDTSGCADATCGDAGGEAAEALRRLAALNRDSCHAPAAA